MVGGAAMGSLGIYNLELLEKLPVVLTPARPNKSLDMPSRICMSVLRELVAVLDCLKKSMVRLNKTCNRSMGTHSRSTLFCEQAERTKRFPH